MKLRMMMGLVALLATASPTAAQTPFQPVAVVNDSVITGFDLAQRAQILVALGHGSASRDALKAEALDQLVEDRLKLQAGERIGIEPTPEMIEAGLGEYAGNANLSVAEFRALIGSRGVTDQALEDFVAAQMVWFQVVRARFAGRVQPGEAEIDSELALIEQRGAFEFRIKEIGLPFDADGRTEAETRALAERLHASLNEGGDFDQAVRRHSRIPSAARGGLVGWVASDRMPPDLFRALSALEPGEVSRPLEIAAGGLSLILLLEKRASAGRIASGPEARDAVRGRLIGQRRARLADGLLQEMRRDALIEIR